MDSKRFDLEERTKRFAIETRRILKNFHRSIISEGDIKQLLRPSASIGANYIEAYESLSKKDFLYRIKICRKEAKESRYWISILANFVRPNNELTKLEQEGLELQKIFGAIVTKIEKKKPKN